MQPKKKVQMAEVDITVNKRLYRISCKDGEEDRIKSLASLINNQVSALWKNWPVRWSSYDIISSVSFTR